MNNEDRNVVSQGSFASDEYEFVSLDTTDYDANLAEVCFKIVEYWTEDYPFEDLLEELEVLPEEALYTLVKAGLIDEEKLKQFLMVD
jgi:hypothetical protein